jgi:hypothetical protein
MKEGDEEGVDVVIVGNSVLAGNGVGFDVTNIVGDILVGWIVVGSNVVGSNVG